MAGTGFSTAKPKIDHPLRRAHKGALRGRRALVVPAVVALIALLALDAAAVAAVDARAVITAPAANARLSGSVVVTGTATAAAFQFYKLEFASGASPTQWSVIGGLRHQPVTNGTLGVWDVGALPAGAYTLKLTVVDNTGNYIESTVPVTVGASARQTPLGGACTEPAKPVDSLVLVPLAARPTSAPPGSPPGRGTIRGRVLDSTGRGVCGLVVTAARGGSRHSAATDDDGSYEIAGLAPGAYTVVVERQICTPAVGLAVAAGQALEVDFAQIRPPEATASPTGTRGPSPTATAIAASTPTPLTATPTAMSTVSPTPAPRAPATAAQDLSRWWGWLGIDVDLGDLGSYLYLGVMGGFVVVVVGVAIALVRR